MLKCNLGFAWISPLWRYCSISQNNFFSLLLLFELRKWQFFYCLSHQESSLYNIVGYFKKSFALSKKKVCIHTCISDFIIIANGSLYVTITHFVNYFLKYKNKHSYINSLKYARCWMLGAGALGQPRGMVWGGRREKCSGWGTHVY